MGRMKSRPTKRRPAPVGPKGEAPGFIGTLLRMAGVDASAENVEAVMGELAAPPPGGDFSKIHTPAMRALLDKTRREDDER